MHNKIPNHELPEENDQSMFPIMDFDDKKVLIQYFFNFMEKRQEKISIFLEFPIPVDLRVLYFIIKYNNF